MKLNLIQSDRIISLLVVLHLLKRRLALKRVDERALKDDLLAQAARRLKVALYEPNQVLLPFLQQNIQLLVCLTYRLIYMSCLFGLLYELRKLLSN